MGTRPYLSLVLWVRLSLWQRGVDMDMVPCHSARGCHPREPQGAVALLADTQLPGAQDLLSCKNTKESVWIGFHHVWKFMDGVNIFHTEKSLRLGPQGHSGSVSRQEMLQQNFFWPIF